MKKQALSLAVLVAGSFPVASNALSLGDIRSNSSLNQPLRAKIELLSTSAQEAKQLKVRLASKNVFNRVGVDRPAFLNSLRFRSVTENGKPVILITSDTPIAEPFVNFLLEVSWPQGQLLKEYTVMLDPPVLMQPGTALAGKEAAVRAEPRSTGVVSRPPAPSASPTQIASAQAQQQQARRQRAAQQQQAAAQQQRQRAAQQQRRAAQQQQAAAQQQRQRAAQQQAQQRQRVAQRAQPARSTSRTYRVRRGDTLFKVATRLQQPGTSVDQMMIALYRANPGAFIKGNINGLKAGHVLRAPSARAARSTSRAQARRQVRQQYAEWKKFRSSLAKRTVPQKTVSKSATKAASNRRSVTTTKKTDQARLEVLGKADKASTSKGASAGSPDLAKLEKELALANESVVARQRENKELKSRIAELESMLRKKNRLIALRDDQLAQLQEKLSTNAGGKPANAQQNAMVPKTANSNGTQPRQNVVPRTTGEAGQANVGRDIQNQTANAAQAEKNKIVRTEPPVTAEQRAKKLADDARKAAQDKLADKQSSTDKAVDKPPFVDQQESDTDLMGLLTSPMAWKIGAGALASLLLLWLLSHLFGRRKTKEDRIAPVTNESMPFGEGETESATASGHAEREYAGLEAELDKAEQYNELDDDPFGTRLTSEETDSHVNNIVEADSASDEDEVLMEANVYIAYGLHQQAESELKKALEKHPDRLEYRHKLLENYFASNNRDEFDVHAAAYMDTPGADKNSKMWREIAEWGGKISPDNKLYQQSDSDDGIGSGALAAGAAAVTAAAGAGAAALMGSGDADAAESAHSSQASVDDNPGLDDFDFDLNELENELDSLESEDDSDTLHASDSSVFNDAPALDGTELADTVDDSLDFSLDDLADELEQGKEQDLDPATGSGIDMPGAVSAEVDNLAEAVDDPLDFDALLNGSEEAEQNDDALPDLATPDSSDDEKEGGVGVLGGLAAGAVAAAGAATAAVMSGKDKVVDALSDAGQAGSDAAGATGDSVENALDFSGDSAEGTLDFAADKVSDASDAVNAELGSLDDMDFGFDSTDPVDSASAVTVPDDLADGLDFNLDQLEPEVPVAEEAIADAKDAAGEVVDTEADVDTDNVTNLNLHLDQDSGLRKILPQDTFYAQDESRSAAGSENDEDSWLGDIDDALSFLDMPDEEIDLHEAHITTKLDLARAYLDMGDIEGARSTLEEVMVEGNDNQRREAETLLHETG